MKWLCAMKKQRLPLVFIIGCCKAEESNKGGKRLCQVKVESIRDAN